MLHPLHHTGTVSEFSAKLMIAFISSEFSGCIISYDGALLKSVYLGSQQGIVAGQGLIPENI
jgi:hypothetical protein